MYGLLIIPGWSMAAVDALNALQKHRDKNLGARYILTSQCKAALPLTSNEVNSIL